MPRPDLKRQDLESDDETDQTDPRKSEDWKLQKRKGFMKDREENNSQQGILRNKQH